MTASGPPRCGTLTGVVPTSLSYLSTLVANGVHTAEIPRSGHWPMYAHPTAMWDHITAAVHHAEPARSTSN